MNGLPKGRGVASVHWNGQRMDAGLRGNYISGFYDTSAPLDENGNMFHVDSWLTFNAFVGFRFGNADGGVQNYLRLGVNNLLDEDPPFADEHRSFYESIHDPRGRFIYAEWRVRMWGAREKPHGAHGRRRSAVARRRAAGGVGGAGAGGEGRRA